MKQSINEIFSLYLSERKKDLAPKTFRYYKEALGLMEGCFNSYGYTYLDDEQTEIFDEKFNQNIEFCNQFGAEALNQMLFSEFLGYFLPKKVVVGFDGAQKICAASLKFYKWLVDRKLIKDENAQETIKDFRFEFNECWKESNKFFEENDDY